MLWHDLKVAAFWLTLFAMVAFAAVFFTLYEVAYRDCMDVGGIYSLGECTPPDTVKS